MKKLGNRWNKQMMRRVASAVLALVLFLGILPTSFLSTRAAHWTDEYIETLVDWGVMRGDVSGNMNAEKTITRAEFVAMVNRAFGYSADTTHPFVDVRIQDWFHNDIGMAYNVGYFKGTGTNTASPNSPLTREQAVVLIGRNLLLDEKLGEALGFSDSRTFGDWSRGMVESAISAGFIGGYDDGSFRPQKNVTRGEVAAMLVKAIGTMVNKPGTHELGGVYGNVMISNSGVKLKNTTIAGDLYITGGLELGDVLLENVNVLGKIVVSGAGESHKGDSSIVLRNVEAGELVVDSIAGQFVTLRAEGNTQIDFTNVKTSGYLDDQTKVGDGLLYIEMNGEAGMNVSLAGNIEEVLNRTPDSALMIAEGTAQIVTVDEKAVNSTLEIKNIASINKLNLDIGTPVTGEGDVKDLFVNAAGSVVDMLPDKITIRPGLTAEINGEEMDTKEGNESSSEPRILSGYPKIKNLAPNSVEVVYSANKKGTIHWALTSLIDGPVKVEDLLEVKDYNTKILQQGTIDVTESNKEFRVKITNLLSDGSYYVSAVLVDSRDQKSPVKYITFTTPDGTAPAFASGYPELTLVTSTNAQVTVMPTKSSVLYYAVLPKGAAAPTVAEFKAGSISGDLGNCFVGGNKGIEVVKNKPLPVMVTAESLINGKKVGKLEELKSYELYLCLIDPDNGKDSGVKKISFTTTDGTPPELMDAIPTGVQKNAIKLTTSMNEAGIIYWVAVKEKQEYPVLPNNFQGTEEDAEKVKQLQIINGMGNVVKAGKVNASANKDVVLNITGLEPESSYDIYYLAQDKAGNCSVVKMINQKTLDTSSPSARQEFTKTSDAAGKEPLPETDIRVIFSETVQHEDNTLSLAKLYDTYKEKTPGTQDSRSALDDLVNELEKTVQLWDVTNTNASYRVEHDASKGTDPANEDVGTWINYEKVEIEVLDSGEMVILFRNGEAVSLSSGSTYQLVLEDLTDTATPANPMKPNPYRLDPFTTVFAQVNLSSRVSSNANIGGLPLERGKETPDGKGGFVRADADMRFWMNPQSTKSINDNVFYDMWIETSGHILYFDLYCRVLDTSTQTPSVIKDSGVISMFGDQDDRDTTQTNEIFDADGWIYLGNMVIRASGGTSRASVNSLINGDNATAVPQLNSLNDSYTYEFLVDMVQIDRSTDELSWSDEVTLNILIPAGQDLSGTDYAKDNPWSNDVVNIGNPQEFSVSRKFVDTKTPIFKSGYPKFTPGDAAVDIDVMLDRPGTLFYVVAPLNVSGTGNSAVYTTTVPTTIMKTTNPQTEADISEWLQHIPTDGTNVKSDHPIGEAYTVENPTSDAVALMVDKGISNTRIKTGRVEVGSTLETIRVPEDLRESLEPVTTYLMYCILMGESQRVSNVYIFQFTTEQVSTPQITLELKDNGSSATARTSTAAVMDWAIYSSDMITKIFGTQSMTELQCLNGKTDPKTGKTYTQMVSALNLDEDDVTIIKALTTPIEKGVDERSLFDVYASDQMKNTVLEYIQYSASSNYAPQETFKDLSFATPGAQQTITPTQLKPVTSYYLLTAAKNPLSNEYGFKAIGGMRKADNDAPDLIMPAPGEHCSSLYYYAAKLKDDGSITGYIYATSGNGAVVPQNPGAYAYKGSVRLQFTEPIFQMITDFKDTYTTTRKDIDPTDFANGTQTALTGGVTLSNVAVSGSTITFDYEQATKGCSITIFKDGSISDGYDNVARQGSSLVLTFVLTTKTEYKVNGKDQTMEVFDPHFELKWVS